MDNEGVKINFFIFQLEAHIRGTTFSNI